MPELNLGQLALLLRARFLRRSRVSNKVQGQPFKAGRDPETQIQSQLTALRGN